MGIRVHCDFCELRVDGDFFDEDENISCGYQVLFTGEVWCMRCVIPQKS